MYAFSGFLILVAFIFGSIGFIKPRILMWHKNPTRLKVFLYSAAIMIVGIIVSPSTPQNQTSNETDMPAKAVVELDKKSDETTLDKINQSDMHNPKTALGTLTIFLDSVKNKDWMTAARNTQLTQRANKELSAIAQTLQNQYFSDIYSYEIKSIKFNSDVRKSFIVELKVKNFSGSTSIAEMTPNVICESGPRQPDPNGTWGVNYISAIYNIKN